MCQQILAWCVRYVRGCPKPITVCIYVFICWNEPNLTFQLYFPLLQFSWPNMVPFEQFLPSCSYIIINIHYIYMYTCYFFRFIYIRCEYIYIIDMIGVYIYIQYPPQKQNIDRFEDADPWKKTWFPILIIHWIAMFTRGSTPPYASISSVWGCVFISSVWSIPSAVCQPQRWGTEVRTDQWVFFVPQICIPFISRWNNQPIDPKNLFNPNFLAHPILFLLT